MAILKVSTQGKDPSWVRYIHRRIANKKNFLCLVSGQTGSGKSWSCLSVALMLDKNFDSSRIVFGLRGLMDLINSQDNFPAGTVFVWDEFQIEAGNRSWQSLTNKLLNSLLSTFRHKRFIVLINAPYADFIDSHSKKLLHAEWEVQSIDYSKQTTKIKPMVIQYNSRRRQFYYKYLRVNGKRGIAPIKAWNVPKPPKWLVEDYEGMKNSFTRDLNREIQEQLDLQELKKKKKKPLTQMQADCIELTEKYRSSMKVAEILGITPRTVQFHLSQARKKGYKPLEQPLDTAFKDNSSHPNDISMG